MKWAPTLALSHATAFLGAPAAGFGTALAMSGFMPAAFRTALFTDFRAHPAELRRMLRSPGHEPGRQPADCGTINIGCNAICHHGHVILP